MTENSLLTPDSRTNEITETVERSQLATEIISWGILLLAVIALAFSPIFTKLSEIEISPSATIFNRLWIATVILSVWQSIASPTKFVSASSRSNKFEYKQQGLLILASISATFSSILWAISFTQTSVASSTVLRSLTPLFISFGAWLILKQNFNRQFLLGMLISIIGGMAIGWDDLQLGTEYLIGDGLALLSAALHALNILTVGYLRDRDCTTTRVLFWRCGFGALIALPVVLFTDTQLFPTSIGGWLIVVALALVCQTFGQGLLVFSLKRFDSSLVGIFTLLKPIVTAGLAWLIFAEELNITSAIAVILILFGIYLAKSSSQRLKNNRLIAQSTMKKDKLFKHG